MWKGRLASGYHFSACLDSEGFVWTFGRNQYGEQGNGTQKPQFLPKQVPGLTNITAVDCGGYHVACVSASGDVYTFGGNDKFQLGFSDAWNHHVPGRVEGLPPIRSVHCGGYFTICVDMEDYMWTFGDNNAGQLGRGTVELKDYIPGRVNLPDVELVAPGGSFTIVRTSRNHLYGFGLNNAYQLALPGESYSVPQELENFPPNIIDIVCGWEFTIALTSSGKVYGCGNYLLNGPGTVVKVPVLISGLPPISSIEVSAKSCYFIDEEDKLWGMGYNHQGDLMFGKLYHKFQYVKVLMENISLIGKGTGAVHMVARDTEGEMWVWGLVPNQQEKTVKKPQKLTGYSHLLQHKPSRAKSALK